MRNFAVLLCLFSVFILLCPLSGPLSAKEDTYMEDYGPLDMGDFIGRSIEEYIAWQQLDGKTNTEVMGRGYLIDNVLMKQWVITRSLVHGFTGFQAAIDRMRSDEVTRAIVYPEILSLWEKKAERGFLGPRTPKPTLESIDINSEEVKALSTYQAHKRYTDILEEVDRGGFFGGETIFKKMQFFGIILLAAGIMVHLCTLAYRSFIEQDTVLPINWFRAILRFITLMFLIIYSGRIAMFGISMADQIKGSVLNGAFPGMNGMTVMMDIMDAKMDFIAIKMSFSLEDFLTSIASKFVQYGFGYVAYFLASGALFILIIGADVMMGLSVILAPVICTLSLIPGYESVIGTWFKGYISLLFYGPLAAVFVVLLTAITAIGIDTSPITFIIVSVAFILGTVQIPNMARELSGTVLAGMAISVASIPIRIASSGVSSGVRGMIGR